MKGNRRLIRRIIAIVLCAFISFAYMPGLAYAFEEQPAEETEAEENLDVNAEDTGEVSQEILDPAGDEASDEEVVSEPEKVPETVPEGRTFKSSEPMQIAPSDILADPETLLQGYMDSRLDEELGVAPAIGTRKAAAAKRKNNLNDNEILIYNELSDIIYEIATGKSYNTWTGINVFEIFEDYLVPSDDDEYEYKITSESLGINSPVYVKVADGDGEDDSWDFSDEAKAKIDTLYDFKKTFNALMADEPYPFYWYDKTQGCEYLLDFDYFPYGEGSDIYFSGNPVIDLLMPVSVDYRSDSGSETYVNTDKTTATNQAVENALEIVTQNDSEEDLEKLYAYKSFICETVDYDHDAADDPNTPYGDPWQMIRVFDDDPDNNYVVCEGYSKAFQYLCDHTTFNVDIECDSVTGEMNHGNGKEKHMWNILHMDDNRNYVADITNSDEGNIGDEGGLFISPAIEGGSVDDGYQYDVYGDERADITYIYDDNTRSIFSDDELEMSTIEYGAADTGKLFINGDGSPDLWSDQNKEFTVTKANDLEGEIKFRIGINSNGDDGSWDDPGDVILSEDTHYSWDSESGKLTLFGGAIFEATGEQDVEIFAYIDNEDYDESDPDSSPYLATAWTGLRARGARTDYDREWDREMLPGWDGDIDGHYGVQVQNAEYPDGWWTEYDVTNVEVVSDENELLRDFFRDFDENDEDSYWWHYEIKDPDELDGARGTVTFEVTYRDIDGNEDQYTFDVNVVDDVYEAWFQPVDGSYKALPGGSIELKADGNHQYCRFEKNEDDPDDPGHWEHYEDDEGIVYGWKIEQGDEFATLEVSDNDPSCAVLRFNPADNPDDYRGETEVSISVGPSNDQLTFRESKRFFVEDQYYEIWPVRNNANLDIEDSETIDFELRHYMLGSDYTVVDQETDVQYSYEGDDRVTAVQDEDDDSIFTFTRNSNDDIDFEIEARWDSEYGPREERGGFGYNRKEYDVWFEHEGDRVYTDGTFDYVLNMDRLGSDWRDRYDIEFKVGQREWNEETQTDEWVNVFSNTLQYTIVDGNIVRLNGPMLKTHIGEGIDIHAEVKLKGKDIMVCEADDWAEVAEAWEDHDFPGYYDESTDEFKQEITLLRGWDEYIGQYVAYWGGNAENPDYWGSFLVSNVTVTNGDSVVVEPDEEGDGWSLRPEKLGDSTVSIEFTDLSGFSAMESPYVFTVHVENDFFDASIDSTDGKFRVGPGESINLRAYALHKYTVDTEDGSSWIYEEDQDGLSYEWVLEDEGLASLVQDPEDPSKAVLTFKSAEELGSRRDGTRVTVKVKYNGKVVAEKYDYYAVLDEYAWIEPRTIDPDIDYKDTVEIDLETWLKENDADARKVPGDISYTWSFNNNDVIIEEGIPAEGEDTGYSYERIWDNTTTESNHFRITRRTDRYTRIVLRAEWGMNQSVWHAFYFDPKSYEISLNGYDDEEPAIIEGKATTFNYTATGFSEDTTFDAFVVIWDEEQQDWADVEGLPEGAVTVAPADGGFAVTLSDDVADVLIDKDIRMFNISTLAYKNGNAIWAEEGRPISVVSEEDGLEAVKQAAKAKLDNYKNADDYRPAQKTELAAAIAAGKAAIDAAADEAGVEEALAAAKAAIDVIQTDAQMTEEEEAAALATAKENAKAELTGIDTSAYSGEDKTNVENAIAAGLEAIEAATTIDAVNAAKANALETIASQKTDAQKEEDAAALATAKENAKAELTGIDTSAYSGAEKTNVENAITEGIAAIEAAGTVDAVNTAKTNALNTISAQKTDAQKAAEAAVTPAAPPAPVEIIDLPAVKISKPKAAKKKITVKWKKVSKKNLKKISGIQIQVATDPGFTNIVKTATAGKKKTSKVIKGLQPKTKYYVRIRAYAAGDHYSVWKGKSAKVK